MHGDHFAAHILFSDLTRFILRVARPHGAAHLGGHDPLFNLPVEKCFASVTRPKRAIAVEGRDSQFESDDVVDELGSRSAVEYVNTIMSEGTSAERQLRVYQETGDLKAVVQHLVNETRGGVTQQKATSAQVVN